MAVYQITIDGKASDKLRRAKNRAQAVKGIVDAKALTPDEIADAIKAGATFEDSEGPELPQA